MKRLLTYNAIVLIVFYGIWVWGWFMSEYWMHVIDMGAPWSWIAMFFTSSFTASLLALRKPFTQALEAAFACALINLVAIFLLWFFSMPFLDPYW